MRLVLVAFVLGATLAGAITAVIRSTPDEDQGRASAVAVSAVPTSQPAPGETAERLKQWSAASLARPLFAPNRRPFAQAQAAAAPLAALPRLSGIVTTPAGSRAIFAAVGAGKPAVVVEGGSVGSYQVQSIANGEVVLVGPDGRHSLRPSFDRALSAASPAAPPVEQKAENP